MIEQDIRKWEKTKIFLLFVGMCGRCVYMFVRNDNTTEFTSAIGNVTMLQGFLWYIFEFGQIGLMAFIIMKEAKRYLYASQLFFLLCVCDLVDFVLTGNHLWVDSAYPLSLNILWALGYGLATFWVFFLEDE